MSAGVTAKDTISNWKNQLNDLFREISLNSRSGQWSAHLSEKSIREEPFGLGSPISYHAPILTLTRPGETENLSQRITFEPKHRYTIGSAGRIDIYSYPALRELMLLRIVAHDPVEEVTVEEAEELVRDAPWRLYTDTRIPLADDINDPEDLVVLLDALVS